MKNNTDLHHKTAEPLAVTGKEAVPPPPSKNYARAKLSTVGEVSKQLATLYREARSGRIDVADASRLANILSILSRMLSDSELEARVEELEKRGWH